MAFDSFRRSFDDLIQRATAPEDRRGVIARMRDTIVSAKVASDEMRTALAKSQASLDVEQRELATVRRRKEMAERIDDKETVAIAAKYEAIHAERVQIVQRKVEAQTAELELAERDVEEMTAQLKSIGAGTMPPEAAPAASRADSDGPDPLRGQMDSLARERSRKERDAEADRRLDELKRRMGQSGGGTT